jgi:hypothetical protein
MQPAMTDREFILFIDPLPHPVVIAGTTCSAFAGKQSPLANPAD